MDYEKAFKEAYERASLRFGTNVANELFLEYKESKEERTRRKLIEFFSDWSKTKSHCWGIRVTDIMDWLEKQGKQKPFDYENATIVQKDFAPKGEPRFNIGDWIVSDKPYISNDYRLCKVVGISDGCYTIQTIDGRKGYNTFKEWEIDYHLWSIEDAKDGDVLYHKAENGIEYIVMSKGINEYNNIDSYFRYSSINGFGIDIPSVLSAKCDSITPATKEQRDLLFQKMKGAGYTFDFENKELKKIEQKPTWTEADDEELEIAINTLKDSGQYDSAAWLITLKQRIGG